MASLKLVVFNVDNENYGVEITNVDSIQEPMEVFKVPNTPDYVQGLINLRGKIFTVFNLRKKFNLPDRELDSNSKIIIIKYEAMMVGFIVDQVNEIVTFEDSDIEKVPEALNKLDHKYIKGIAKRGDKIVLMLDLTRILTPSEEAAAAALSK